MLVIETEKEERDFIITDTKRLYHKTIDDEVDTWWAFNSKRIIVRESKFDFDVGGLQGKFKERTNDCKRDPKKTQRKSLIFNYFHKKVFSKALRT